MQCVSRVKAMQYATPRGVRRGAVRLVGWRAGWRDGLNAHVMMGPGVGRLVSGIYVLRLSCSRERVH